MTKNRTFYTNFLALFFFAGYLNLFCQATQAQFHVFDTFLNKIQNNASKTTKCNLNSSQHIRLLLKKVQGIESIHEAFLELSDAFLLLQGEPQIQEHHIRQLKRQIKRFCWQAIRKVSSNAEYCAVDSLTSYLESFTTDKFVAPYTNKQRFVDTLLRKPIEWVKENPKSAVVATSIFCTSVAALKWYANKTINLEENLCDNLGDIKDNLGDIKAYAVDKQDGNTWVARQVGNSCHTPHALGRAAMVMRHLKDSAQPFHGKLDKRTEIVKTALPIVLAREKAAVQENAKVLGEVLDTANELKKQMGKLVQDATSESVGKNHPFYVKELEGITFDAETFKERKDRIEKQILCHKNKVNSFVERCKKVEISQKADVRLLESFAQHLKQIIYLVQPTVGEWNMIPENGEGLREIIGKSRDLSDLRKPSSDWTNPKEGSLAKQFSLVSQPKTWAKMLCSKQKCTELDFLHLIKNAKDYRKTKKPQVITLAMFNKEDQEFYRHLGHWATLLVKRNTKTGKDDVDFMESTSWLKKDTNAYGQTYAKQLENIRALSYILSKAKLPEAPA